MASKKNNLPKKVENETTGGSTIVYANEVVATIAGVAANEIEGIAGMCNLSGGILGKNKNITKGVKVEVGPEEVSCDLYIIIEYGRPIQKVAQEVQENVRKSLEAMTGLHVVRVDVHVQGVSFEKENDALTDGAKKAKLPSAAGDDSHARKTKKPDKAEKAPAKAEKEEPIVNAPVEIVEDSPSPVIKDEAETADTADVKAEADAADHPEKEAE